MTAQANAVGIYGGYFAAQVTVADRHEEWARDTLLGEIDELTQAAPRAGPG